MSRDLGSKEPGMLNRGKGVPGRANRTCKDSEVGKSFLRSMKTVGGGHRMKVEEVKDEVRGINRGQSPGTKGFSARRQQRDRICITSASTWRMDCKRARWGI